MRTITAIVDLIGSSANFRALPNDIDMFAPVDSAVLTQSETGSGKEVVAPAKVSPRRNTIPFSVDRRAPRAGRMVPGAHLFGWTALMFAAPSARVEPPFRVALSPRSGDGCHELAGKLLERGFCPIAIRWNIN